MTKYKEYFNRMLAKNKKAFDDFRTLHKDYSCNPNSNQEKFNQKGEKILKIIHEWENKLCRQSEKAGYANFTANLSEKFQKEIKREFPLIDHVGIIAKKQTFSIKKISL